LEWSIQELAKLAGTTSRALRHYDEVGLLPPSSIGANGYRYYDEAALVRLQRILLLRELGLGLPQIAEVLDRQKSERLALEAHLAWLRQEQERLARQIQSVTTTIDALKGVTQLMAEKMFDGFDHTRYKDEVEERWGKDAYQKGDAWWRGLSDAEKRAWKQRTAQLSADWAAAAQSGAAPDSPEAQAYLIGLGEMYVADPRFAANYATDGSDKGAVFVRDALRIYAEANL
jgi:DNA-binding transcriptional MerR regulator